MVTRGNMMDETAYLKERLDNQITWYDKKSQLNQRCYKVIQVSQLIAAASIPLLSGFVLDKEITFKLLIGGLGTIIAILNGIEGLLKFQENWIEYRTTCESLRHEKYFFDTKTNPYDGSEPFHLLVERVEALISKENSKWTKSARKKYKLAIGDPGSQVD